MLKALNEQVAKEMYSANLYLSMSSYFHSINLNGFANWMRVQTQEESAHAMMMFDYIVARGGTAVVAELKAPPAKWDSPLAVFEAALAHEQYVTESINNITDIAISEKDHAANIFLQWFVTEQVEEEANASEIVDRLKLIGESKDGLFYLDNELKSRVFVPPSTTAV